MDQKVPNSISEVCAVVTTYWPDNDFPKRIEYIRNQVGMIVIVNDGESVEKKILINLWFGGLDNIKIIHNLNNVGIAASLNNGIKIAKEFGFKWFLTLDDDSTVYPAMVISLIKYLRIIKTEKPIGVIGMSWCQKGDSNSIIKTNKRLGWSEKRGIITSGSLFSLELYANIGPFRDEFIIGSVDYDFCLRARAKGYRIVSINETGFVHSLGKMTKHNLLGFKVNVFNHSATRLYYSNRNSTILAKEYFCRDPLFSLSVFKSQLRMFFIVLLFEQDKTNKLRYMSKGLSDGWRNRLGKTVPVG